MPAFTDQTGRTISLDTTPRKIISLVPSQTELLYDLGLDDEVAGITKFCSQPPEWFHRKTRIGGTKHIHTDIIHSLQPDLILANKEENVKEQVEALAIHYPVWISDISTLDDACEMIKQVGLMTGRVIQSSNMYASIFENFARLSMNGRIQKAVYLIWRDPYMTVGHDTFIHDMLSHAGFENIFAHESRYPVTSIEEIIDKKPDVVMLSSEPYPFSQQHLEELQPLFPNSKLILVDGSMFSWYGSRLQHAPGYFRELRERLARLS